MIERIIENNYWYRNLQKLIVGGSMASRVIAMVNKVRRYRARKAIGPSTLVLFVTNRCQMRCPFCFYQNSLNSKDSILTLKEITKLANSLKTVRRLSLTGGEPFLRKDLIDISRVFRNVCRIKYLNIPTNGLRTKEITEQIQGIVSSTSIPHVKAQISIDALGSNHDRLRDTKGAFEKAVKTLKALQKISEKYPHFNVEIAANVNTLLIAEIKAFVSFFSAFQVPLKFSIIRDGTIVAPRGLPKSSGTPYHVDVTGLHYPTLEQARSFYTTLIKLNSDSSYHFWSKTQQLKYEQSLRIIDQGRRLFPCYAGLVEAVIYHTGDVSLCEYSKPIGNLRDFDFNFKRLWRSDGANHGRHGIQSCVCIHGCNLLTSMSYDDSCLTKILTPPN